jgi:hypothetical protein
VVKLNFAVQMAVNLISNLTWYGKKMRRRSQAVKCGGNQSIGYWEVSEHNSSGCCSDRCVEVEEVWWRAG